MLSRVGLNNLTRLRPRLISNNPVSIFAYSKSIQRFTIYLASANTTWPSSFSLPHLPLLLGCFSRDLRELSFPGMATRDLVVSWALAAISLLCFLSLPLVSGGGGVCELGVVYRNTLYNYSLASPTPKHPHGVLSEDGFYKVSANDTVLWFQLCDQMIFNHDPPLCFDCQDCGGPLRCGMQCSALVSNNIGGYDVCTTIGKASNPHISLIDKNNPQKGVIIKMVSVGPRNKCSLSVSVLCDSTMVQVPSSFNLSGSCDYATILRHPSGCPKATSVSGKGWGWFGTLIMIILCLLGAYFLVGTVYRFFFLGIHGVEAIPNLEFWISLPQRAKVMLCSLARRLRARTGSSRATYSPMNY